MSESIQGMSRLPGCLDPPRGMRLAPLILRTMEMTGVMIMTSLYRY